MSKLSLRERAQGIRLRHQKKLEPIERRAYAGTAGAVLGILEKKGIMPVTIAGVPYKPVAVALATFVEMKSTGTTRRAASALADALLAIYSFEAAKQGTWVAGEY